MLSKTPIIMKTIQEVVCSIISKKPFLEEVLYDDLINVSSLARQIKPQVQSALERDVNIGSITVAINRISPSNLIRIRKNINKMILTSKDYIVKMNLVDFTFKNSHTLINCINELIKHISLRKNVFFAISKGTFETSIIISDRLTPKLQVIFKEEIQLIFLQNLSSITINFSKTKVDVPGIYYYFFKQMAWANISVQEIISTNHELILIIDTEDVKKAFSTLLDLK